MTTYRLKACPIATLPLPGWECFFARNDQNFYPTVFHVWVVRGNGSLGLIDTGLPLDFEERAGLIQACQGVDPRCEFTDIITIDQLLAREGIRPEQIDWVAITQAITYHDGGLVEEFFPRAQVYISRAGMLEFLLEKVGHPPRAFYFTKSTWAFLRKLLLEDRLHLVDEETEIRPGILYETTGGHHPGSAAVRIQTERGVVGILETAFLQRNLEEELPIGVAEDAAGCRRAIKRYKRLCDIVVADHDPSLAQRFGGD